MTSHTGRDAKLWPSDATPMPAVDDNCASQPTKYLNATGLESIDPETFRNAHPFPWINPAGIIQAAAYEQLRRELPPVEMLKPTFGRSRRHGQKPHDRYVLEYHRRLPVADSWHEFVAELNSPIYRDWIEELMGVGRFFLTFHWHYTPRGCSVSPHCDAPRKLGSQIFYLNTEDDWDPAWGGQTLLLDDHGRFNSRAAPAFEDFDHEVESESLGNRSLLFGRKGNSWHGVREIDSPEGKLRKVFIVVVNRLTPSAFFKAGLARLRAGPNAPSPDGM